MPNDEKPKQDDIVTLTIRDMGMNGEGIAAYGAYTVFVPFALQGEEVRVKIGYVKRNLAYGTVVEVLKAAPERVRPVCNRFGKCGGCDWMHAEYAYQLQCKTQQVRTALAKAKVQAEVAPCVASDKALAYRNKIMLPFGVVEGQVALGFYREGTHKVVRITQCRLHDEWASDLIAIVVRFANTHGLSVYDGDTHQGLLRHLVARYLDGHIDVTVVINGRLLPHWQELGREIEKRWPQYALYVSPNTAHGNVVLGKNVQLLAGASAVHTVHGIAVNVNPLSFLQVNEGVCDMIYRQVMTLLQPLRGSVVVDAFAGVGLLGAMLAKEGADVHNVEIVPQAVEDADRLAQQNRVTMHNRCGDSAQELPAILRELHRSAPRVIAMRLQAPYFEAIADGRKQYELRLNDEKRRGIAVGDVIAFESEGKRLFCRVTSRQLFATAGELFAALGTDATCATCCTPDEAVDMMNEFYGERQAQYGLVALGVQPVGVRGLSVVLDPPRKGCPAEVVDALVDMAHPDGAGCYAGEWVCNEAWDTVRLPVVERIVYISCNPATLARDLAALCAAYKIQWVQPYDMFPQTHHVETVVKLSRSDTNY